MPARTAKRELGVINYQANNPVSFEVQAKEVGIRNLFLDLTATLNVTGGGGTAVARNPGTVVPNIRVVRNYENTIKNGRWVDWIDRGYMYYGKAIPQTRDTALVNATTVRSRIMIPFAMPMAANPEATNLRLSERERLDIVVQWGDENSLVSGGAKAFTGNPVIEVSAELSRGDPAPVGVFKELATEVVGLGAGALVESPVEIVCAPLKNLHSMLMVCEDTPGVAGRTLADPGITEVILRQEAGGEQSNVRGPLDADQIQQEFDLRYGTVAGVTPGLYPFPFVGDFEGKWGYSLPTGGLDDLRYLVSCTGFATTGSIRVLENIFEPIAIAS